MYKSLAQGAYRFARHSKGGKTGSKVIIQNANKKCLIRCASLTPAAAAVIKSVQWLQQSITGTCRSALYIAVAFCRIATECNKALAGICIRRMGRIDEMTNVIKRNLACAAALTVLEV